jgi:hypothetical protein
MFLTHARPRAHLAASALLAAAALGLTACGGDAEGQPDPTASPATSAAAETQSSTPEAAPKYKPASADGPAENVPLPKMPKEAKEKSKAGLEAFTRYWYELLNYAYESGDLKPLEKATAASCLRCQDVGEVISDWHSEGRWMLGGQVKVDGTGTDYVKDGAGNYQVAVQLTSSELRYYSADRSLHDTDPKSEVSLDILVAKYEKDAWLTIDVGVAGEK